MKKAVVTGGAGFIGSHLAEELARRGYKVIILDDLSTGKKENIEGLTGDKVDFVFHLAAIPSVPRSLDDPLASHSVNITGTLNALIAARDKKVEKVVYTSSSSVYGNTPLLPKREDITPNPQSPYAVTKISGEYYCKAFQTVYGLDNVCLRYFNVYGPRQDPDSKYAAVMPRFISRAFACRGMLELHTLFSCCSLRRPKAILAPITERM